MYDEMMLSFLGIVLTPYVHRKEGVNYSHSDVDMGLWEYVHKPTVAGTESEDTWKNLFNWKLFTKKHSKDIIVE